MYYKFAAINFQHQMWAIVGIIEGDIFPIVSMLHICQSFLNSFTHSHFHNSFVCIFWKKFGVKISILVSIVVSIPACHAGDRGSIPRRGGYFL